MNDQLALTEITPTSWKVDWRAVEPRWGVGGFSTFVLTDNGILSENNSTSLWTFKFSPTVTHIAGNGLAGAVDGSAFISGFGWPLAVKCHPITNDIYFIDGGTGCIRRFSNGVVSTYAGMLGGGFKDGFRLNARFSSPGALVFDSTGNLYVSDTNNIVIKVIIFFIF